MAAGTSIPGRNYEEEQSLEMLVVWAGLYNVVFQNIDAIRQTVVYGGAITESRNTPVDDSNRRFIKLEQSFLKQLEELPELFGDQNKFLLQEKMKVSTDPLLSCSPDKMSLELTNEGSIFYTLIKNDITIYLQHYLIDRFDETDEAIVSVYKGDHNSLNYGGALVEVFNQLSKLLISESIAIPEFA